MRQPSSWPRLPLGRLAALGLAGVMVLTAGCKLDRLLSEDKDVDPGSGETPPPDAGLGAARLDFGVPPRTTLAGSAFDPDIEVRILDQSGGLVTSFTGQVSLGIEQNSTGASLRGVTTREAVGGMATFPAVAIDRPGAGYRLRASVSGLPDAISAPFDITARPPAIIAPVSGDGQYGAVGTTLPQPFVVRVTDAVGTPVAGVAVTWTVTGGGGSIAPTTSTTDQAGEASALLTLGTTAGPQTAAAAVAGLAGSPSTFTSTAVPGAPARLLFATQPTNTPLGGTITPPVRVVVEDAFGNVATGFTGTVTVSIAPATGTPGAVLTGTTARRAEGGEAVFDDLRIDLIGLDYRLRVTVTGLTADSQPFNVLL